MTSVSFAVFSIVARKGLGETSPYAGAIIGLAIGIPILGGLSLVFSDWGGLTYKAALWFFLGGIFAPGFSRLTSCFWATGASAWAAPCPW